MHSGVPKTRGRKVAIECPCFELRGRLCETCMESRRVEECLRCGEVSAGVCTRCSIRLCPNCTRVVQEMHQYRCPHERRTQNPVYGLEDLSISGNQREPRNVQPGGRGQFRSYDAYSEYRGDSEPAYRTHPTDEADSRMYQNVSEHPERVEFGRGSQPQVRGHSTGNRGPRGEQSDLESFGSGDTDSQLQFQGQGSPVTTGERFGDHERRPAKKESFGSGHTDSQPQFQGQGSPVTTDERFDDRERRPAGRESFGSGHTDSRLQFLRQFSRVTTGERSGARERHRVERELFGSDHTDSQPQFQGQGRGSPVTTGECSGAHERHSMSAARSEEYSDVDAGVTGEFHASRHMEDESFRCGHIDRHSAPPHQDDDNALGQSYGSDYTGGYEREFAPQNEQSYGYGRGGTSQMLRNALGRSYGSDYTGGYEREFAPQNEQTYGHGRGGTSQMPTRGRGHLGHQGQQRGEGRGLSIEGRGGSQARPKFFGSSETTGYGSNAQHGKAAVSSMNVALLPSSQSGNRPTGVKSGTCDRTFERSSSAEGGETSETARYAEEESGGIRKFQSGLQSSQDKVRKFQELNERAIRVMHSDNSFGVIITQVLSGTTCYAILIEDSASFTEMHNNMLIEIPNVNDVSDPRVGCMYASYYDEEYWRVKVMSIRPLKVFYVDFGNEEIVSGKLKNLPPNYTSHTPFIFKISMVNINCMDDTWSFKKVVVRCSQKPHHKQSPVVNGALVVEMIREAQE